MFKQTVSFHFNIPCGKKHMASVAAIELIKKYTGRKNFKIGNRAAASFSTTLIIRAKNQNNLNNLLHRISGQLEKSTELNACGIKFIKTGED